MVNEFRNSERRVITTDNTTLELTAKGAPIIADRGVKRA